MKNFIYLAIISLLALSCSEKDEIGVDYAPLEPPKQLFARFATDNDSRSSTQQVDSVESWDGYDHTESRTVVVQGPEQLEGKYDQEWSDNDAISFFISQQNLKYVLESVHEEQNGDWQVGHFNLKTSNVWPAPELSYHYAVYPYHEKTTISADGVISYTFPATQTYQPNSYGPETNVMVAVKSRDEERLFFKNACGYLKVQLTGTALIKTIEFKGLNDEKIAGPATISASYDGNPVITMGNKATTTITLNCGEGVQLNETTPTEFWFVIPPTNFEKGITIKINGSDEGVPNGVKVLTSSKKAITITRNHIKPMGTVPTQFTPNRVDLFYRSTSGNPKIDLAGKYFLDANGNPLTSTQVYNPETDMWEVTFDGVLHKVENNAFQDISNRTQCFETIIFAEDTQVEILDEYAFYGCSHLKEFTVPTSVQTIGKNAFQGCTSLETFTVPEGSNIELISTGALSECPSLQTVTITGNVETIGKTAFSECESLENLVIEGNIGTIGDEAFGDCVSLKNLVIEGKIDTIGEEAFEGCESLEILDIKGGVNMIEEKAFEDCENLTKILIEGDVHTIGAEAFEGCDNLKEISISGGVDYLEANAFKDNESLEKLTITGHLNTIGESAFEGCTGLTDIYFVDIHVLKNRAFWGCESLQSVEFSDSVKIEKIEEYTFMQCTSLESITIPSSVNLIERNAFEKCTGMTSIEFLPSETTLRISCMDDATHKSQFYYSPLESIVLDRDIELCVYVPSTIGYDEFVADEIGQGLFDVENQYSLTNVTIGDNVTSIPPYMFAYNKSLTSITIPENITSIGLHAFRECSLLQTVECLPISPPAIDYTIFSDNDANFTIYVPSESLDNYKQKWVQYADEIQAK